MGSSAGAVRLVEGAAGNRILMAGESIETSLSIRLC